MLSAASSQDVDNCHGEPTGARQDNVHQTSNGLGGSAGVDGMTGIVNTISVSVIHLDREHIHGENRSAVSCNQKFSLNNVSRQYQ